MTTILVVDDDPQYCDLLKTFLESTYTVYQAHNVKQALDIYTDKKSAVVISDVLMPEEDGLEFMLGIKSDLGHSLLGIIMISGGGKVGAATYLSVAESLGASDVLEKPLKLDVLSKKIEILIKDAPQP